MLNAKRTEQPLCRSDPPSVRSLNHGYFDIYTIDMHYASHNHRLVEVIEAHQIITSRPHHAFVNKATFLEEG